MKLSPSVLLVASAQLVVADVVFENELIKPEEIFDLVRANDSAVKALSNNATRYYCIFRSNWSPENHPEEYPQLASWGNPMMFSHTKQYAPFLKNRAAPYGVEQIAEVSFLLMLYRRNEYHCSMPPKSQLPSLFFQSPFISTGRLHGYVQERVGSCR
jgi:hypothetical protein